MKLRHPYLSGMAILLIIGIQVATGFAQTPSRPSVGSTPGLENVGPAPEDEGPPDDQPAGMRCATPEPSEAEAQAMADQLESWLSSHPGYAQTTAITTIPVAMHVVRGNSGEWDVTDGQISSQIAVLNAAYANTNFRFSLASTERTNNATWSTHPYALTPSAGETAMKNALAISPATTLNFYITNLPNYLGYARFPWEYPETSKLHGVVCRYTTLPGGSQVPYHLGDTGTHEVGHYVGLYHTFAGGCGATGDQVADTPPEAVEAFGCPHNRDTCAGGGLDPIYNFMDYTDDACMIEFTAGQSARADQMMAINRPTMMLPPVGPPWVTTTLPTPTVNSLAFTPLGKPMITYQSASPSFLPTFASRAGGTWTPQTIENLNARQTTLAVDGAGNPHAIYLDFGAPGDLQLRQLRYAKRTGTTWAPEPVFGTVQGVNVQTSDITLDSFGSPWIAFSDHNGQVQVAFRNGPSWGFETAGIGGARGQEFINIVVPPTGNMAVSWGHGITQTLYCSRRTAPGIWDRQPVDTSTDALNSIENSLAINSAGQPVIAYYLIGQNELKIATRQSNGTWLYQVVDTNLGTTHTIYPQLDIDSAGNLHLVYNDRVAGIKIYAAKIGAGGWTFSTMSGATIQKKQWMRVATVDQPRIATGDMFWDAAWEIKSPVAGASWVEGSSRLVSWAGTGTANVEWSPNGGGTWQTVASSVPGDETNITVPLGTTTNGRVRVNRTITPTASAVVFPISVTSIPPPAIADLGFATGTHTGVIWWTAPDDGNGNTAALYDLRYNISAITEGNFSSSTQWPTNPPQPPGSPECMDLTLSQCRTYYWAIKTRDAQGVWSTISNSPGASTRCSGSLEILCAQAVEELAANAGTLPAVLSIGAISPNPASTPVVIPLSIPADLSGVSVEMNIFDVTGRLVRTIDAGNAVPGDRSIDWDLRESSGRDAANGVYFVRVKVGSVVENRRVLLAR